MKEHTYFVYMMASRSRVLYIGMTNNLRHRVWEHKNELLEGFTREYKCHRLVFFESFDEVAKALDREKQLKRWNRTEEGLAHCTEKPTWEDLSTGWYKYHQFEPEKQVS
jgi:putative endonuclease